MLFLFCINKSTDDFFSITLCFVKFLDSDDQVRQTEYEKVKNSLRSRQGVLIMMDVKDCWRLA